MMALVAPLSAQKVASSPEICDVRPMSDLYTDQLKFEDESGSLDVTMVSSNLADDILRLDR